MEWELGVKLKKEESLFNLGLWLIWYFCKKWVLSYLKKEAKKELERNGFWYFENILRKLASDLREEEVLAEFFNLELNNKDIIIL